MPQPKPSKTPQTPPASTPTPPAVQEAALLVHDLVEPFEAFADLVLGKVFEGPAATATNPAAPVEDPANGDPPKARDAAPAAAGSGQPIINVNLGDLFKRTKPKPAAGSAGPPPAPPGTPAGE